jgi:hypothetical protein
MTQSSKRKPDRSPRGRNEHLTHDEIASIRLRFNEGAPSTVVAGEMRCTIRVVQKYYAMFRGNGVHRKSRRLAAPARVKDRAEFDAIKRLRFYTSDFEL